MNKRYARELAETITREELLQMLSNAKEEITDWGQVSSVNKSMTKGAAWNVLAKGFSLNSERHILGIKNMIWEFGDYLPAYLCQCKKARKVPASGKVFHQDPLFD